MIGDSDGIALVTLGILDVTVNIWNEIVFGDVIEVTIGMDILNIAGLYTGGFIGATASSTLGLVATWTTHSEIEVGSMRSYKAATSAVASKITAAVQSTTNSANALDVITQEVGTKATKTTVAAHKELLATTVTQVVATASNTVCTQRNQVLTQANEVDATLTALHTSLNQVATSVSECATNLNETMVSLTQTSAQMSTLNTSLISQAGIVNQ